ncbi:MAG: sensor histidine kinase [Bacteroidota bacterium]
MENLAIRTWQKNRVISFHFSPATWLTITYLLLSVSWILASDWLATHISGDDRHLFAKIQALKGLLFVFISAAILFMLSRKFYIDLRLSFQQNELMQAKYNAVNEAAREGFFDCDLINMTAKLNNKMKFFFPVHSNEVEDFWERYQTRIHPDDINRLLSEFEAVVASGKSNWLLEYQLLGSDNKYYIVISSIYIVRDKETGKAIRLVGAVQDMTELRNLQAEYYEERLIHKQRLTASIIKAQENEKERWAGEMHDNVCQILGLVKLHLSEAITHKESSDELLPEADTLVSKALDEIRQLSASIKPPSFEKTTLTDSIEKLAASVSRFKYFDFTLNAIHFEEQKVSDEQRLSIYRIIQEQLNNIVKYAGAGKVEVNLSIDKDDRLHVMVKDDGKGFDPGKVKAGIGLRNMESRIEAHKGIMKIQSAPGMGCTMSASFSL